MKDFPFDDVAALRKFGKIRIKTADLCIQFVKQAAQADNKAAQEIGTFCLPSRSDVQDSRRLLRKSVLSKSTTIGRWFVFK